MFWICIEAFFVNGQKGFDIFSLYVYLLNLIKAKIIMKLDPVFVAKENKLYSVDGKLIEKKISEIGDIKNGSPSDDSFIYDIVIPQNVIEPEKEIYNEEYLASLRDFLKVMEEKNIFAVLTVMPGRDKETAARISSGTFEDDEVSGYIACVKHTARRVKDCVSVAGIKITDDFAFENAPGKIMTMMDEILPKHAQYVFFASDAVLLKAGECGADYTQKIVRM